MLDIDSNNSQFSLILRIPLLILFFVTTLFKYSLSDNVNSGCFLSSSTTRGINFTLFKFSLIVASERPDFFASSLNSFNQSLNPILSASTVLLIIKKKAL